MKLAFLSHTAMGGPFVVGSHQLAANLAAAGHEILHVSAPLSCAHLLRLRDPFVRTRLARWFQGGAVFKGVRDVVPLTLLPWQIASKSMALMQRYSRAALSSPVNTMRSLRLDEADCLIVDEPRLVGLVTGRQDQMVVYRATDLYASMRRDMRIIDAERLVCQRAQVIVATSEAVAAHLRALSGRAVQVIGNGVDFAHFSDANTVLPGTTRQLPGERRDRAVFIGSFDSRFSRLALQTAARALQHKQFILAGPGSEKLAAQLRQPNVTALGAVDYDAVPALLRECSVGLLPFSTDESNLGRSPMKLYEYAAAGLAIAATSTLRVNADALPTLRIAASETLFPAAVAAAFELAADAALIEISLAAARSQGWPEKAQALLALIRRASGAGELTIDLSCQAVAHADSHAWS